MGPEREAGDRLYLAFQWVEKDIPKIKFGARTVSEQILSQFKF